MREADRRGGRPRWRSVQEVNQARLRDRLLKDGQVLDAGSAAKPAALEDKRSATAPDETPASSVAAFLCDTQALVLVPSSDERIRAATVTANGPAG